MTIKQKYTFTNNRQLWRILISGSNKLIIEDRDVEQKQAFFSCIDARSGYEIFRDFQLEEKFWVGIEAIYKDIIFFHKFAKPDMPAHKQIIAFDIQSRQMLWQNDKYAFLFIHDDRLYMFRPRFEGRDFFTFDYRTGEMLEELGSDSDKVNLIHESGSEDDPYKDYLFPEVFHEDKINDVATKKIIQQFAEGFEIQGNIEYIKYSDLLLFNYYAKASPKNLINRFIAVDLTCGEKLLDEVLNSQANAFVPDSFFMKDNLVLVLREKKELLVLEIE